MQNSSLQTDLNEKNSLITKLLPLEKDYYQLVDKIKLFEIQNQNLTKNKGGLLTDAIEFAEGTKFFENEASDAVNNQDNYRDSYL